VDLDGNFWYSFIVLIKLTGEKKPVVVIYPNPVASSVNISLSQHTHKDWLINLYSASGQLIVRKEVAGTQNEAILNIATGPAGIYQVVISEQDGALLHTGKLIRQ